MWRMVIRTIKHLVIPSSMVVGGSCFASQHEKRLKSPRHFSLEVEVEILLNS